MIIQRIKDFFRGTGQLFGAGRSNKWASVRRDFLILNPACRVCGKKGSFLKPLEVHHCIPFSEDKSKELNFENLITLCREHHFLFGHLMNWKSWSEDVKIDAKLWYYKITNRPKI